ncbi:UNVERIFIED_ORG: hypothetical protein J2Y81_001394 [Paraburkholderia sediminicola]|uniref:Uncharacterized protein n=1 Tax=Paraburkholderia aspalathi TaxID=1324617 RepID=A0A1I7EDE6_9BURK|nr:hypothetical protein [Paraburkholderia sediminicola]CAE6686626.1 hypothetical protein R69746_00130 [Paraburkholderia aspalathi]CAE6778356.1 hypothetical protein R20943_04163 [Paraburkholderia aspalathi]SFU21949.1 hypothetical protein SAMN05192563_101761 [Paraburkholderia aspalathi]
MTLRAAGRAAHTVPPLFVSAIYNNEGHGWTGYWLARR